MKYMTFTAPEPTSFEFCILTPFLNQDDMEREYIVPHLDQYRSGVLGYDLHKTGKRTKIAVQREYLEDLSPILTSLGVKYLIVTDAEYFKTITKQAKADDSYGYVYDALDDSVKDGGFKVVYCPNYRQVFYNPEKIREYIRQSLTAVLDHRHGNYREPGKDVIDFAEYPRSLPAIKDWLQKLYDMDCPLSSDIETFGLKHYTAGIGTIGFAWSQHEGIAFPVDYHPIPGATAAPYGRRRDNKEVRDALREFFIAYAETGRKMRWHSIGYDVYVLIYQLFMEDLLDTEGLLYGMDIMLSNWDCTKLITYLATNSCAGNELGLKIQSQEFAGQYGMGDDIKDITKIPIDELLEYNLVDCLATNFVFDKHWPTVLADDQLEIYDTIFKPAQIDIIQMQLTGLPLNRPKVLKVQKKLQQVSDTAMATMLSTQTVAGFMYQYRLGWLEKENAKLKTKVRTMDEAEAKVPFKANSPDQLQLLLYGSEDGTQDIGIGLPVIDRTKTKAPATGGKTLKKLVDHPIAKNPDVAKFLEALIEWKAVDKLLTAFIPAMLEAPQAPDGWWYLFGNFNLGGTVSGRLSSSGPNLQNLPSNGKLAKIIKDCFEAPPGWLFVGLDFASLEDRISALTTKDPNKLKVYTDGYDGHCLRAHSYFAAQMPDIDPYEVSGINSIEDKYPDLRQDSKGPTFLLTYGGTFIGMMAQFGMDKEKAIMIEERYHDLYRVSDEWVAKKVGEASMTGYVTVAFGLRVRTPKLKQVILGTNATPYEATAESRTAGNALGQSWCLLNSRAGSEFLGKVRSSKYRLDIKPCAQIHDAGYMLIRDNMETLVFTEHHMVEASYWQDHPDIAHPDVPLGGELSVFYPTWAQEMTIPNHSSPEKIKELAANHYATYCG